MGNSRPFRQAVTLTFFLFKYVMDDHKKMTHQFSDFFESFSGSNGLNHLGMRAVIDSFEIYSIQFLKRMS